MTTDSANELTPTPGFVSLPNADTPAFPTTDETQFPGLTKREYFTALIFQSLLPHDEAITRTMARGAVRFADALLAALEEPSGDDDTEPEHEEFSVPVPGDPDYDQ